MDCGGCYSGRDPLTESVRSRGPAAPEEIEADAQGKKNGDGCHEQPSPEHPERPEVSFGPIRTCAPRAADGACAAPRPLLQQHPLRITTPGSP